MDGELRSLRHSAPAIGMERARANFLDRTGLLLLPRRPRLALQRRGPVSDSVAMLPASLRVYLTYSIRMSAMSRNVLWVQIRLPGSPCR
jgi:hypothetical protein